MSSRPMKRARPWCWARERRGRGAWWRGAWWRGAGSTVLLASSRRLLASSRLQHARRLTPPPPMHTNTRTCTNAQVHARTHSGARTRAPHAHRWICAMRAFPFTVSRNRHAIPRVSRNRRLIAAPARGMRTAHCGGCVSCLRKHSDGSTAYTLVSSPRPLPKEQN